MGTHPGGRQGTASRSPIKSCGTFEQRCWWHRVVVSFAMRPPWQRPSFPRKGGSRSSFPMTCEMDSRLRVNDDEIECSGPPNDSSTVAQISLDTVHVRLCNSKTILGDRRHVSEKANPMLLGQVSPLSHTPANHFALGCRAIPL